MAGSQLDLWDNHVDDQWISFRNARSLVHALGLEYEEDWAGLMADPNGWEHPGVPENPDFIYRHTGWNGWKDWLVHPDRRVPYHKYEELNEFVWCLRLPDERAWFDYINSEAPVHLTYNFHIPARPFMEYREKGWVDWADWLGNNMVFRGYAETNKFVRSLKLRSQEEWNLYCKGRLVRPIKKPKIIYRYPEIGYKGFGWVSWEEWLGL